eukprot:2316227-Pleurochrysis_carterae.AAC.2
MPRCDASGKAKRKGAHMEIMNQKTVITAFRCRKCPTLKFWMHIGDGIPFMKTVAAEARIAVYPDSTLKNIVAAAL